ncbi:MAG: anthranilate synthase component I [Pirellulales bacterium]|nr:anthranilate synthase component I [Pirellulales bacterium]
MPNLPDFAEFDRLAATATLIPVARSLLSDQLTPVTALQKLDTGNGVALFESVVGGERIGRYTFLLADPAEIWEARGTEVTITRFAASQPVVERITVENPLATLRTRVQARQAAKIPGLPPFTGGAVGYAGYDVVRFTEHLPNSPPDDRELPDYSFGFFDRLVVFDNIRKTIEVIALASLVREDGTRVDARTAYEAAQAAIKELTERLESPLAATKLDEISISGDPQIAYESNFTPAGFCAAVEKCVEYIRAGDIFQVVLSQRLNLPARVPPLEIYRTLRVVNPSPFMFFLRMPTVTLVGSSPEVLVRVVDGEITVRPLAGTRKRGADEHEDRELAEELLADPKERAEHVMLVDLGRNDVGRVARFGTVELSDVMVIERYSHVMHITSNVTGQLAEGQDAFAALAACLPAGTVSGAPKVRAMQIIDELEPHRRGPYAGAVGYFDYTGNLDCCIALRTIVICNGQAYVQAGAGIVADSVPELEYQETLNKARGVLKAIELTEQRLGVE